MNKNFHFTSPKLGKGSKLVSFEGIEGSGKSTQVQNFIKFLESQNKKVLVFREPGGTKFGENLRQAILDSQVKIEPIAEAYLFASARAQLLSEAVLGPLESPDTIVILDRYIDSSIAYQGFARGLGIDEILQIHQHSPLNIMPEVTFYLRIDLETSLQRQMQRGNQKDYFEKEKSEFYQKLIDGYDQAQKYFPARIKTINAKLGIEEVSNQIKKIWGNL